MNWIPWRQSNAYLCHQHSADREDIQLFLILLSSFYIVFSLFGLFIIWGDGVVGWEEGVHAEWSIWVDARAWELFFICSSPIESNTAHLSRPIHPLSSNHISGLLQVEKITYSSAVMCLSSECSLFPLPTLPFLGVFIFAF